MPFQAPAPPAPATQTAPAPTTVAAQTPQAPDATQPAAAALPVDRVFGSEAGIIFNAIKPTSVADFENVLMRLKQALLSSADPVRRSQAAGWKIFKAAEPGPNGSVLYVFVMDPAVKGANYGVARILAEAYPEEALSLYRLYSGAFAAGQTMLNLEPR
jgi:hypothetical protein